MLQEARTGKGKVEKVRTQGNKKDVPRVFINPGHGGHDSDDRYVPTWVIGAQDTLHYYESNSNLTKGLALEEILQNKGYETMISRTTNYTEDDLQPSRNKAQWHSGDLVERPFTDLHIAARSMGLGCVNSWGAWPRQEYQMPYQNYSYTYIISPVK